MLSFPPAVRIWLALAPADLRKGFDALAELVRQHLREDPLSGHLFVFRNRRSDRIKLLYWDTDGYVIGTNAWRPGPFVSQQRPKTRQESPCVPRSWPGCWTASIGKTPSGPSAIGDRRRRRDERAGGQGHRLLVPISREQLRSVLHAIGMSLTGPTAADLPPNAERLPDDVATLQRMVLELLASLHERDRDIEGLRHRIHLLLRRLYGPRGERIDPNQLLLFAEMVAGQNESPAPGEPTVAARPKRRCRPHGCRRLPEHLPRESRHHELSPAERTCPACGQTRVDIGTDRSEQLDYRPASLFVVEHFTHKYVCPCCSKQRLQAPEQPAHAGQESKPLPSLQPDSQPALPLAAVTPEPVGPGQPATDQDKRHEAPAPACQTLDLGELVIAAPKPPMPIAKGLPGPGLLAHLIVNKYTDHMPLHRLQRAYERQGYFLHRSTLCDWLGACADLLRPLYDRMVCAVLQSRVIHTDDTPVKLQELLTHLLSTARLWVYLGDAAHPYNVFDFTVNRKRDGPQQFLANYQGYLQADAFSGYEGLYLPDPRTAVARIIEVACNAHARR
jgi:transposase